MTQQLRERPVPYRVWGREYIDSGSFEQMENAARLPVAVAGALMPDAHVGYGLPIGGVLATRGAVIPYAVGVDIACRMRLSVFPASPIVLGQQKERFRNALVRETLFGAGGAWRDNQRAEHEVLDDADWEQTYLLRKLRDTAYGQLGTSGSGNHFVEWGALTVAADNPLGLKPGEYLALLSHSGSRGVGFQIANHYSRLAMDLHPELDKSVRHLAWLSLDSETGHEYWLAMQLAGRFAAANHEVIHRRIAGAISMKPAAVVENHHNFAWKERIADPENPGRQIEVIIHRKGATPAGTGVLGVIPGSMADAGYVVQGLGNPDSLYSAAHGAGRLMSRKQALRTITKKERDAYLQSRGVTLIGGDLDEAPQVYKSIDDIIQAQQDLVDVVARFVPRLVRMDGKK